MKKHFAVAAFSFGLVAMSGTAQAQNFDDALKTQLVNGCKTDMPKRMGAPLPAPAVEKACGCIFTHLQTAPSKDEMNWQAVVTALETGEVKGTDKGTVNAGLFTGFYPVTLQEPAVAACMASNG
ncbi:MAG TPA: hypothetical protein VIP51_11505 [Eoetvoesiella sp.]